MISEHNPFAVAEDGANGSSSRAKALANFFNNANIQIIEPEKSYSETLKEKKAMDKVNEAEKDLF